MYVVLLLLHILSSKAQDVLVLSSLKVNSIREPISIDDPQPSFSWRVDAAGKRGVVTEGYELEVDQLLSNGTVRTIWATGEVNTNQTQFIPWPKDGPQLMSDADYSWRVRAYPGPSEWSDSTFSTGLLEHSDWDASEWVQSANESDYAAQMRKVFTIQPGRIKRARVFVALPGFGNVWVNGHKVDGRAGTRSLSQYNVRALYHTYDIKSFIRAGEANTIAV
jgi:alpha-L-rhamnosidase